MRVDIELGAKTEIQAINGAIVAEGKRIGVATPVNATLVHLIQAIEQRGKL